MFSYTDKMVFYLLESAGIPPQQPLIVEKQVALSHFGK